MLSIRMQRTGRKGHAMFRVVVQESRLTPTSGKVVATLGSYDPHAKTVILDKDKAATFLKNGAQPSDRAALLLQKEGVKLPGWVKLSGKRDSKIRNPEKLRRNNPVETPKDETPAAEEVTVAEAISEEAPTDEAPAEEPTTEETAAETPTEAENDPATETGTIES
jgi:small subunit ribosomal protein S16